MKSLDARLAELEKRAPADADTRLVVVVMRPGCEPLTPAQDAELDALCELARKEQRPGWAMVEWPPATPEPVKVLWWAR